jgi:hypothetical protein
MKIRLNAGNNLVGYFEIEPANKRPPIMAIWGIRTFIIRPVEPPPMDDCAAIYDEVTSFVIEGEPTK